MNDDEIVIFIQLRTAKNDEIINLYNRIYELDEAWTLRAIPKYLAALKLEMDEASQLMTFSICNGCIGHIVKCLAIIKEAATVLETKKVDFDTFCMKIFPFGFPDFTK